MTECFKFKNVHEGYLHTRKGKRDKKCVGEFEWYCLESLISISDDLQSRMYKIGEYEDFYVYEPKKKID